MSNHVVFLRPIESVGKVYDLMRGSTHSNYVVVDPDDNNIIYGTIPRNALCILLQQREFGLPAEDDGESHRTLCNYLEVEREKYVPLIQWQVIERAYPKYPTVEQLRISENDREYIVDLRPYCNQSPVTVHEAASVEVSSVNAVIGQERATVEMNVVLKNDFAFFTSLCSEPTLFSGTWVSVSSPS